MLAAKGVTQDHRAHDHAITDAEDLSRFLPSRTRG